ncbi:MAG: N-6 DNA methylase [Pseudomonadota bacterium]
MEKTLLSQLSDLFFHRGFTSQGVAISATALLAAWHESRSDSNVPKLFATLADRLAGCLEHDAIYAARQWLQDPGLTSTQWEVLEKGLALLHQANPGPIDWTAELSSCLAYDRQMQFGANMSLPLARAVARAIAIPMSGSCACLFISSASIAWALSSDREVTLYASEGDAGIVIALMARAACRTLKVDRRNPIDASYMPASVMRDDPNRTVPFGRIDHIISVPPLGMRVSDGPAKGMSFEAYQLQKLAPHARHSFSTIISDGLLFRESRQDVELRRSLAETFKTTVLSLPTGMFWPATGVQSSVLSLEPAGPGRVRVIDGRSMDRTSTGRVQESLIVKHLEQFQGLQSRDPSASKDIGRSELAAANFSFVPDRYLRSDNLAQVETAMSLSPLVTLADIAEIERPKAPIPLRDDNQTGSITAMEIAPSDVVDGLVTAPKRQLAFDRDQATSIAKVTVREGDILVSIKGNVGIIGMVALDVSAIYRMGEPWIISQSLAIIRLKPNPHVPSPEILHALLTAPWVREKLESMSGAATVRTLPISAVRSFSLPVPTAEECALADEELAKMAQLRSEIEIQMDNLAQAKSALWHRLWHVTPTIDEE